MSQQVEYSKPIEDDEEQDGSEGEQLEAAASTGESSSSKKKSKKKKGKTIQALSNLISTNKDASGSSIPQELVDHVQERVKLETEHKSVSEEEVRKALQMLKAMDVLEGKSGVGGKNRKDMGEHKFWKTQPVPQIGEERAPEDGPIEPSKPREEVRQEPYPLPKDFSWSNIDVADPAQLREVYELLSLNYVEDADASFRFQYSAEFFDWALKPPGYHQEWHIGVRAEPKKKLVAFISGVPIKLRVRQNVLDLVEINFLCVHKKLRSKRLAPVMIKEVTRQCHLLGIFQAIYTAGVVLPGVVTTCRYFHRSLNVPKLVDVGFTYVPRNSTLARMLKQNALPKKLSFESQGLREMETQDVEQVSDLFERYMARFDMSAMMSVEEIRHNLISGRGTGETINGRRERQVVWSYVVEDPTTKRITDFFSFYSLPSTVIKNPKHNLLNVAYMFYYASETAFQDGAETNGLLQKRLVSLVEDALILAERAGFDVFNAMSLMDNDRFLSELKFGHGDGYLNFYLYNWRTAPLEGFQALPPSEGGRGIGRGVGVVML